MNVKVKENGWTGAPPDAPLVGWIGDDFTGSATVMEVLAFAGLPSILFLSPPSPERLASYEGVFGVGIATMSRTCPPDWMDAHLPDLFGTIRNSGAGLVQYKVCSTLDSAPETGSIGRAMEIGMRTVGGTAVPVLVACPAMRRYQAFGNLFAAGPGGVTRLDRHPVMARHPVTPMHEADVARHIAQQTDVPLRCLDLEALADVPAARRLMADEGATGWCFDQVGPAEERAAGEIIWEGRAESPFVVGSQGIEFALVRYWQDTGLLAPTPTVPGLERTARMAAVSGSVSPVTAAQIDMAEADGFEIVRLDALKLGEEAAARQAVASAVSTASLALEAGRVPLVCTARGPDDPAVAQLRERSIQGIDRRIGEALGEVLRTLITTHNLRRVLVSGGDTSGDVCTALGIHALSALSPTAIPGAGICRAHADGPMDGLEIALKGGQMGSPDYFAEVRDGGGR